MKSFCYIIIIFLGTKIESIKEPGFKQSDTMELLLPMWILKRHEARIIYLNEEMKEFYHACHAV